MSDYFGDNSVRGFRANNWDAIFDYVISKLDSKKKLIFVLDELKARSKKVLWNREGRKEFFGLYSKPGFTKQLIELAKRDESVLLFSINDFYQV